MHIEAARDVKVQLRRELAALIAEAAEAGTLATAGPVTMAFGICPGPEDGYGVAIRHSGLPKVAQALTERGRRLVGAACDSRDVGTVHPLTWAPEQLRGRSRPLRPGLSVAHVGVRAGTIGAFVRPTDSDRPLQVLSNNHVVADADRGAVGDVVLQPAPADGGQAPADRIGVLARVAPMSLSGPNLVDAATVALDDDVAIDDAYPVGPLAGWADADVDLGVEKVGRTTGPTRGRVSAIELDGLTVLYPVGLITFDGQLEVTGDGSAPFAAGGDSGSVVYDPVSAEAVGLLFAGSARGGPEGSGLAYCNPFGAVIDALDVRLGLKADEAAGADGVSAGAVRAAKRELAARLAGDPRIGGVGITRWQGRYAIRVTVADQGDTPVIPASLHGVEVHIVAVGRIAPLPAE